MEGRSFIGIGVALGVSIGAAIGAATDNLALWLSLGIAIGAGLGVTFDQQQKKRHDDNRTSGDGTPPHVPGDMDGRSHGKDTYRSDGDGGGASD